MRSANPWVSWRVKKMKHKICKKKIKKNYVRWILQTTWDGFSHVLYHLLQENRIRCDSTLTLTAFKQSHATKSWLQAWTKAAPLELAYPWQLSTAWKKPRIYSLKRPAAYQCLATTGFTQPHRGLQAHSHQKLEWNKNGDTSACFDTQRWQTTQGPSAVPKCRSMRSPKHVKHQPVFHSCTATKIH